MTQCLSGENVRGYPRISWYRSDITESETNFKRDRLCMVSVGMPLQRIGLLRVVSPRQHVDAETLTSDPVSATAWSGRGRSLIARRYQ